MAKIIEFAKPVDKNEVPDYTGRLLALNPEKARKFQCGGFILGPRMPVAIVTPEAQMYQIHRALEAGLLLDITDDKREVKTEYSNLSKINEEDTGQKVYFGLKSAFRGLKIEALADITEEDMAIDEVVCLMTSDPEEQRLIDEHLKQQVKLVLPPGMDNPEKYLLKLD